MTSSKNIESNTSAINSYPPSSDYFIKYHTSLQLLLNDIAHLVNSSSETNQFFTSELVLFGDKSHPTLFKLLFRTRYIKDTNCILQAFLCSDAMNFLRQEDKKVLPITYANKEDTIEIVSYDITELIVLLASSDKKDTIDGSIVFNLCETLVYTATDLIDYIIEYFYYKQSKEEKDNFNKFVSNFKSIELRINNLSSYVSLEFDTSKQIVTIDSDIISNGTFISVCCRLFDSAVVDLFTGVNLDTYPNYSILNGVDLMGDSVILKMIESYKYLTFNMNQQLQSFNMAGIWISNHSDFAALFSSLASGILICKRIKKTHLPLRYLLSFKEEFKVDRQQVIDEINSKVRKLSIPNLSEVDKKDEEFLKKTGLNIESEELKEYIDFIKSISTKEENEPRAVK